MQEIRQTIRLHRVQQEFRKSQAIFKGFTGGRGSGKSWIGAYDMLRRAKKDRTYLVASPTASKMADETFPTLKSIAEELDIWNPRTVKLTPYPTAKLTTGATIRFRSADKPDSLRGPNLSGIWLDEGSLMEEEAFKIAIGCLREKLAGEIRGEQGWLSCTFTPKGTSHWTYQTFATGQPDTQLFHCATKDNPFLPTKFAETLAKKYSGAWAKQELGGLFVSMEGALFDPEWFGPDIWFKDWPHPSEVLLRIIALDPSMGKDARTAQEGSQGDYSAFVVIYLTKDGTMWVDADMNAQRNSIQLVAQGLALNDLHRPNAFAIEINQYQQLLAKDFLREAASFKPPKIVPVWGWDNRVNKEVRILTLAPILAGIDGRMRFKANSPGAKLLVEQLGEFRFPPHPSSYHDDGPDGLELGVRMLMHLMRGGAIDEIGGPRPMG